MNQTSFVAINLTDPSPTNVLDGNDPGDKVIARFRYQFCVATINAIRLVSQPSSAKSIVCENFEDLIIELHDGTVVAVQVKTKARDLGKIKFN